jgi:hypothetical protein
VAAALLWLKISLGGARSEVLVTNRVALFSTFEGIVVGHVLVADQAGFLGRLR